MITHSISVTGDGGYFTYTHREAVKILGQSMNTTDLCHIDLISLQWREKSMFSLQLRDYMVLCELRKHLKIV